MIGDHELPGHDPPRDPRHAHSVAHGRIAYAADCALFPGPLHVAAERVGDREPATLEQYPVQQETFWFVFAVATGSILAWCLARLLLRRPPAAGMDLQLEILGAGTLAAVLLLPTAAALAVGLACATAMIVVSRRGGSDAPDRIVAAAPASPERRRWVWVAIAIGIALLRTPAFPLPVGQVLGGYSDESLMVNSWPFLAESGQHLAWADTLVRGGLHGRDFFCLYGPLFDWSIVGFWKLLGRSVATYNLYLRISMAAGLASLLLVALPLVRRPAVVLAIPFLVMSYSLNLRLGLPLLGLLAFNTWLRTDRIRWCAVAGVLAGMSLLYSQEYGLAFLLCAGAGLVVRGALRPGVAFALGATAAVAPLLGAYAWAGALGPMLADLALYPSYLVAGYGNAPFQAVAKLMPIDLHRFHELRAARIGYLGPAIAVAALVLALPLHRLEPRGIRAFVCKLRGDLARDPERLTIVLLALFGLIAVANARLTTPREAVDAGFLDEVVPADELLDRAVEVAQGLAATLDPSAYQRTVRILRGEVLDRMAEQIAADRGEG